MEHMLACCVSGCVGSESAPIEIAENIPCNTIVDKFKGLPRGQFVGVIALVLNPYVRHMASQDGVIDSIEQIRNECVSCKDSFAYN
jgi:hypothetical protein